MKYIVYDEDRCILFDSSWNHWGVAQNMGVTPGQIEGAGTVQRTADNGLICSGESVTLGFRSRGLMDALVIARHLRNS